MPRRAPLGDLGPPASIGGQEGWACAAGGWLRGPSASPVCSLPASIEYILTSIQSCVLSLTRGFARCSNLGSPWH
jgi:hypothetical protein